MPIPLLYLLIVLAILPRQYLSSSIPYTKSNDDNDGAFQIPHVNDDEDDNLSELTNAELESICTTRGFELKRGQQEDGDNVVYTHQDYVDAARQCLAIEAEMEKVMRENPEIMQELKVEAERLMAEKARLEERLAATNDKLESSESSNENASSGSRGSANSGSASSGSASSGSSTGGAFIRSNSGGSSSLPSAKESPTSNTAEGTNTSAEAPAGGKNEEKSRIEMGEDDTYLDFDEIDRKSEAYQNTHDAPTNNNENVAHNKNETTTEPQTSSNENKYENMSMGAFARETLIEFRLQVRRDLQKVFNTVLPKEFREPLIKALTPLVRLGTKMGLGAFDMLKRYFIALLDNGRSAAASRDSQEEQEEEDLMADAHTA